MNYTKVFLFFYIPPILIVLMAALESGGYLTEWGIKNDYGWLVVASATPLMFSAVVTFLREVKLQKTFEKKFTTIR
jgi:hypothetical protein